MSPPPGALQVDIMTPDNVSLPFTLAPTSARFLAVMIDLFLMAIMLVAVWLLVALAFLVAGTEGSNVIMAVVLVASFVIRNFYFAFSELRLQGQTIGKRQLGLRVIARDGGPLTAPMIFARNLTRDLEHFLPILLLFAPEVLLGDPDAAIWVRLGSIVWALVLALLPFFNRYRARVGDLIAGTAVVMAPKGVLYRDLVDWVPQTNDARPMFEFEPRQLEIYGIHELQVLEDVLRNESNAFHLHADIAERIKRKIGWDPQYWNVPPTPFLRAFYAAQRQRLEQKMLMGKRQEHKIH